VLVEVPIEVPPNVKKTIMGDVLITMNVDVDEKGHVTNAELVGKINKNIEKLKTAALEAIKRYQFEPARQGDQPVASQTTVKMHFEGEVIRTNLPTIR